MAIPSVSADPELRPKVIEMASWVKKELTSVGATVEFRDIGIQKLGDKEIQLPPIVLARVGEDPAKKTILIYAHMDVQPALMEDGWNHPPFELTKDSGSDAMFGRGSTDDKGPLCGWINLLEAFNESKEELPVNLVFCIEGMEEYGSEGLDDLIVREKDKWFSNVDAVCISDNYWLAVNSPCLTYGLRGVSYYNVIVEGPGQDLHSGIFGGAVHEPMTDLIKIMSSLVDSDGKIMIKGIMDQVAPLTQEEEDLYKKINFTMDDIYGSIGSKTTIYNDTIRTLMARWRYPSLSLHGIEGAFSAPGAKTVIPAKVQGKFSIRTVPNMEPEKVDEIVTKHIQSVFKSLESKNKVTIESLHSGKPWVSEIDHWNYQAARSAIKSVFGVEPDFTREGGSIPVTLTFQDVLQKNVLLLPMGRPDDGAHSINEKLNISNYMQGIKVFGEYLKTVGSI